MLQPVDGGVGVVVSTARRSLRGRGRALRWPSPRRRPAAATRCPGLPDHAVSSLTGAPPRCRLRSTSLRGIRFRSGAPRSTIAGRRGYQSRVRSRRLVDDQGLGERGARQSESGTGVVHIAGASTGRAPVGRSRLSRWRLRGAEAGSAAPRGAGRHRARCRCRRSVPRARRHREVRCRSRRCLCGSGRGLARMPEL